MDHLGSNGASGANGDNVTNGESSVTMAPTTTVVPLVAMAIHWPQHPFTKVKNQLLSER